MMIDTAAADLAERHAQKRARDRAIEPLDAAIETHWPGRAAPTRYIPINQWRIERPVQQFPEPDIEPENAFWWKVFAVLVCVIIWFCLTVGISA